MDKIVMTPALGWFSPPGSVWALSPDGDPAIPPGISKGVLREVGIYSEIGVCPDSGVYPDIGIHPSIGVYPAIGVGTGMGRTPMPK